MNTSSLGRISSTIALGITLSLGHPAIKAQTGTKTDSILENTVSVCKSNPTCMKEMEFFMESDPVINFPGIGLDNYDLQKMQQAFSIGWLSSKKIKPVPRNNAHDGKWSKETLDYINGDDGYNTEWSEAQEKLEIDSYPCIKQCAETRQAARDLLEYVFKKGVGR